MRFEDEQTSLSDTFHNLVEMVFGIWRYRWLALLLATLTCVIGWPIVAAMPDKYEANARVVVDTQSLLQPLLRGLAVESDVTQQFATMAERTLLTRPNLEKVIRDSRLIEKADTPAKMERMIRDLSENINVSGAARRVGGQTQSSVYTLSYTSQDPELSYVVVKNILNVFIESALQQNEKESVIARDFLEKQIAEYEVKLVAAENALKEFKRKNVGMMPTEAGGYFQRYQQASDQLKNAILQLKEARQRRDQLAAQVKNFDVNEIMTRADNGSGEGVQLDPLAQRIRNMQVRLDDLLIQYTEQHPSVVSTRQTLDDLIAQRKKMLSDPEKRHELNLQNPAYQNLTVELSRADTELGALMVRVEEYEREVNELNRLIDTVPKVEAELSKLNRDYDVNRQNYETLLARRESAKISNEAEKDSDQVLYQVIEPPEVPLVPVAPNRLVLTMMVFLIALGVGGGVAWLLGQIKSPFYTVRSLRNEIEFPILGSVSIVESKQQVALQYALNTVFWILLATLSAVFVLLSAIELLGMEKIMSLTGFGG